MANRPLIGLPGRRKPGSYVQDLPECLQGSDVDMAFADYARGVAEAGGLPVYLPLEAAPEDLVERLDGLLLTGGADLSPSLYNAAAETDLFPPEPDRDRFELALLEGSLAANLPVLGICRGLQLMNVQSGGSLHQHVPVHARFDADPATLSHTVALDPDSQVGRLYGPSIEVNSLHHQTVDRLGDRCVATGISDDGTVEAIEYRARNWIAVQWHPEMMTGRALDPIFTWLVAKSQP
jgi:putative glutamine amidotransferase